MNLPNKLTLLRVVMIPLLVIFMLVPMGIGWQKWIAVTIFVLASLTDLADGKIARRYNLITNFGKFMDPLADKLLVCSALICLIELHKIPAWVVLVIIAREFIVSGFRLVAVDQGVVIAASMWGKVKTTVQMIMIILMFADLPQLAIITQIAMWAALVLTVVSLVDYVVKNRAVIKDVR
jgi:CDP-diacylglycerol--glycerol-3-phosphate 3-phosphatidyltransferase